MNALTEFGLQLLCGRDIDAREGKFDALYARPDGTDRTLRIAQEPLVSDTFYSRFNWLAEFAVNSTASASFNSWSRDCFSNGVTLKI